MAIYHLSAQMVKRSEARNSVAMSAYRAGVKLVDEATDLVKDYSMKTKVFMSEIIAPSGAPAWASDRQKLWNKVEASEKRKDAQLAREINVALPCELSEEQMYKLTEQFVKSQFVESGMVADVAFHNLDGDNPHFHVMLTTRSIDQDGFGKKERSWNDKKNLQKWRESWATMTNAALEEAGSNERIDHRSLADQGLDREPQIHVGPTGNATSSIRALKNNEIIERNNKREELGNELVQEKIKIKKIEWAETLELVKEKESESLFQRLKRFIPKIIRKKQQDTDVVCFKPTPVNKIAEERRRFSECSNHYHTEHEKFDLFFQKYTNLLHRLRQVELEQQRFAEQERVDQQRAETQRQHEQQWLEQQHQQELQRAETQSEPEACPFDSLDDFPSDLAKEFQGFIPEPESEPDPFDSFDYFDDVPTDFAEEFQELPKEPETRAEAQQVPEEPESEPELVPAPERIDQQQQRQDDQVKIDAQCRVLANEWLSIHGHLKGPAIECLLRDWSTEDRDAFEQEKKETQIIQEQEEHIEQLVEELAPLYLEAFDYDNCECAKAFIHSEIKTLAYADKVEKLQEMEYECDANLGYSMR